MAYGAAYRKECREVAKVLVRRFTMIFAWHAHHDELAIQEWRKVYDKNAAVIEAMHNLECPNCSWDGKTIFPAAS